jgi:hypothetical protein
MSLAVEFTGDVGKLTATAGTAIQALVPPKRNAKTRIAELRYTNSTTAHLLTVLRPLTNTKVGLAALAGQAVIILVVDPGTQLVPSRPLAANDWIVLEGATQNNLPTFILAQVSSVTPGPAIPAPTGQPQGQPVYNATLQVTLTANLPTGGVAAFARCWMLGITTDGHPQFTLPVSATTDLVNSLVGLVGAKGIYEPLLISSNNLTAAGVLENAVVMYTREGSGGQNSLMADDKTHTDGAETPDPALDAVAVYCLPKADYEAIHQGMMEHYGLTQKPEHWKLPEWEGFAEAPRYYVGHPGDPDWRHPDSPEAKEPANTFASQEGIKLDDQLPGGQ